MRRYRIGRSETNDVVIPDASVSRQHAEVVELGEGRFALTDLGSTFGTHVWQGQGWVPAKDTEIRADTVIRFGEFRTTLLDILSEPERAALGLAPKPPSPRAPDPPAAAPVRTSAPKTPAPTPAIPSTQSQTMERAAAAPRSVTPPRPSAASPRVAARPRRSGADGKRRAMVLGLLAVAGFFALAGSVIAVVLAFGDPTGPGAGRDGPRTTAGEGPRRFLEACSKNWGIEERRCRCFLAAAGPHLQPEDYDDFATMVEGYLSGDADRMESVLQQAAEKRGAPASSRLSAAFKGVGRDCQQ